MSEGKRWGAPTGGGVSSSGPITRSGGVTGSTNPSGGETFRWGGGGSSGGSGSGNIFKDLGKNIDRNPLGAVVGFVNNGFNKPLADLNKGQSDVWRAMDQNARSERYYWESDAKRDANKYANENGILFDNEMGRIMSRGSYYNNSFYGQQGNFRYGAAGQPWPPQQGSYYGQQPYQQPYQQQMPLPMQYGPKTDYWAQPTSQPSWQPTLNQVVNQPPPTTNTVPTSSTVPVTETKPAETKVEQKPAETKVEEKPAAVLADAQGGKTKTHSFRMKAPNAAEIPNIAKNQVKALQEFLIAAGVNVGPTKADGLYGPNTHHALKTFAAEHGITDLSTVDFIGKNEQAQKLLKALGQGKAPAPVKEEPKIQQPAPKTQAELEAEAKAAALAEAKAKYEAAERERPKILVDLPNDMKKGVTVKKLLDGSVRVGNERVEFNGPEGQQKEILKDYVKYVRNVMDARGMDVGKGDSKETAALILAAYNGMSTTDHVRDLQTLRMPSFRDIDAALDSMSGNVLIDRKISGREFKLDAPLVNRVVFGQQVQLSSQVAMSAMPEGQFQAPPLATPAVQQQTVPNGPLKQ